MIILNNYSKAGTYIILEHSGYSIVEKNKIQLLRQGVGGFSEDGQLLGIYVDSDKFFFIHNEKKYEAIPDEVICINERIDDGKRNFKVKIMNKIVCNITYKSYISPFVLTFGDDEDEFDFLLYLSNLMLSKDSILSFIKGMRKLKKS
ncbi:hypothetical protein [Bacillus sp. 166amftsu]|uniref:hypothetical protein n=1 Tax=Bacillus sp. 166amftsu TaxID=1761753 RepID=UPI00089A5255|nr:hypothetical protein [Bacillus sp. 166amftsu]SDY78491.1 hypothetical protein SAMN04488156_102377 [Bacillus sp. 166amftsu]